MLKNTTKKGEIGTLLSFSTNQCKISKDFTRDRIFSTLTMSARLSVFASLTKICLCWGRIKPKVLDKFQTLWVLNMWTCWRSKMYETHQVGKQVKHHQNIFNPLTDHSKWLVFFNPLLQTKVSNSLQEEQLRNGNFKKKILQQKYQQKTGP